MGRITALAIVMLLGMPPPSWAAPLPTVVNAADGIFNAFHVHPLVGLGDLHGMAQEQDFYSVLLRDPRFAAEVGNVVLETGSATQQVTVDRYVNGQNVPYIELRKVWTDTSANDPTQFFIGTINIFDTIRTVNKKLPANRRIKVWLSDPPIDWSKVHTKAELDLIIAQRETYPADLIAREILAKGKKAFVIYGSQHFSDMDGLKNSHFESNNLRALVKRTHPGAFFFVAPYMGLNTKACTARFEKHAVNWHAPALISSIRGTSLEADLLPPGCGSYPILPGMSQAEYTILMRNYAGLTSDALIYFGTRKQLLLGAWDPDIYLDADFRAELDRRHVIRGNKPMGDAWRASENPAMLQPYFEN
jgi:hypothetical protein